MNYSLIFMSLFCMIFLNWDIILMSMVTMLLMSFLSFMKYFNIEMWSPLFMSSSLSQFLVFLSILIVFLALLSTWWLKSYKYALVLLFLNFFLLLSFWSNNFLMFYFFFEASLIPTLMLIIIWGYQPERLQAGTYMMLYTVFASLPLLLLLVNYLLSASTLNFLFLNLLAMKLESLILIVFILAFLVKLPMFSVHLWLPKAHVEAPLSGSMILAGVLLKLGGYGLYITNYSFIMMSMSVELVFISFLSLWGGLLASFMCLRQTDMKAMVAYSSVAHMSLIVVGILLNNFWGELCSKITMIAHGFTSSVMFVMVNMSYKKMMSRSFKVSGGFLWFYPKMSMLWFVFCSINMAAPPSINLLGELVILPSLWMFSFWFVVIMGMMVFFSASYNMYLYTQNNHGKNNNLVSPGESYNSADYFCLFMHLFLFIFLLKLNLFLVGTY